MKKNKFKEERFEFVFYINDNIIVQRYFHVPRYNRDFTKSIELKELMDNLMGTNVGEHGRLGMVPDCFRAQNMRRMWSDFNPYVSQDPEYVNPNNENIFEKEDMFRLEIKADKRVVAQGQFCGNYFAKYVRHYVDITGIIYDMISEMVDFMGRDEYTIVDSGEVCTY
jgi:hypothetical protein